MKRIGILLLAVLFLATGTSFAAKTKYRVFRPNQSAKGIFLKSGENQRRYFELTQDAPITFAATGPTKIKILTRAEYRTAAKSAEYEIKVWEGDNLVKGRKVKTKPSKFSLDGHNGQIGVSRSLVINVPKGKHSYKLEVVSGQADKFFARFYHAKKKAMKKAKYSSFKPSDFTKQLTMTGGKNALTYYLIDNDGGVTLNVIGPTKLRIFCRANFTKDMKGRSKFSLGLFENGKEATQFQGVAKASKTLSFKELGDLIPATLQTFNFDVPPGKHVYEVRKINSSSPSLAVRFKITQASLGILP